LALERQALRAHRAGLARQFRPKPRRGPHHLRGDLRQGRIRLDAALADVFPRHGRALRPCRWRRMGREPLSPQPRRRRPVIFFLKRLTAMVRAYAHHPDPRVAAANMTSLLVASNQPFYPLYLFWLVSADVTAAWFTFLSTPFFLA